MTTLTSFLKTNLVDDHTADDMNKLIAAALRPEFANTETITATKELTDNDCQFQFITASGADRTVELAPEATTNHVQVIYNSGATYNVVVKDDSGTYTFATLAPDEWALFIPLNAEGWRMWSQPEEKYKFSVTVSANDLIVALKHLDSTDPSATRPLCITIAGVKRYVTAATSFTIPDGTNYFNSGSAELGTLLVPYFVYAVWDSNSSIVAISAARIPHGKLVSDFSATTTNDRHLFNYANFTSTDPVANIGYFEATLSLSGTSHLWTVPTFTNKNLIYAPTYESPTWFTWTPTAVGFSSGFASVARYKIANSKMNVAVASSAGTSNATNFTISAPMVAATVSNMFWGNATGAIVDNSAGVATGDVYIGSAGTTFTLRKSALTTWTNTGTKTALFELSYEI